MFAFSDLEDRLLGPHGPAVANAALSTLRGIATDLQQAIASGLSQDDFAQAKKILAASAAAEHILMNKAYLKGA